MEDFKGFVHKYAGAIIGIIVAIIIMATRLYALIIGVIVVIAGAVIGNYIQQNKTTVKDTLKRFIDKM